MISTIMPEKLIKIQKKKHARKYGFRRRNKTRTGRAIIKRRRLKGRKRI